jgi:hypothetical protein
VGVASGRSGSLDFWAVPYFPRRRDPRATPTVANSPVAEASGPGVWGWPVEALGFSSPPCLSFTPGGVRERIANYDVKDAPLP